MRYDTDIKDLTDSVVKSIDIDDSDQRVLITLEDGRSFVIEHHQDCCESVWIDSGEQDMLKLQNKKIVEANVEYDEHSTCSESGTVTLFKFRTDEDTVVLKWIGESNGYYSETADIYEIT